MAASKIHKKSQGRTVSKRSKKVNHKYIFVIGGVMSGVGKGIASSSIALLLTSKGYRVNNVKVDPYLNVDAGTMNPTEHGEVFVLESGLETDQDMGNYERFLNHALSPEDYMTSGMIYKYVIDKERALGFKGKCIDGDTVRDEIIDRYHNAARSDRSDISVIEIGGTVGDFQNALFIEAARFMKLEHPNDVAFVLVSYLPVPGTLGEMKTRPTQNAIHQLNSYGVQADFVIARSSLELDARRKEKIAVSSNVPASHIIAAPDVASIYDVPLHFEKQKVPSLLLETLSLPDRSSKLTAWKNFVEKQHAAKKELRIAVVGKYFDTGDFVLSDAYLSVIEALKFSAAALGVRVRLDWINAKEFEKDPKAVSCLKSYNGILVPGGFGETGIEGKLQAIKYAREHKVPYFGLCYGMQLLVVEYARNVLKLKDAHTVEINPKTKHPIIDVMPEQKDFLAKSLFGGTMRLGTYTALLGKDTIAREAYGKASIEERHRHRYEVNPDYVEQLKTAGLVFSGTSPNGVLMEIAELPKNVHPFMLGTQFHPELQARPLDPHPLFTAFMKAVIKNS